MSEETRDTLKPGEPHPSTEYALHYISSLGHIELMKYLEAYSSCAIENNRLAEVCAGTLNRLLKGEPVSDRYLLGLAWSLKILQEKSLNA
jgi:hypothetical protein